MEDERLSFDLEDLDRDALIDEAVEAFQGSASLESFTRSTRSRRFSPETDVVGVLQALKAEKAAFGPRRRRFCPSTPRP